MTALLVAYYAIAAVAFPLLWIQLARVLLGKLRNGELPIPSSLAAEPAARRLLIALVGAFALAIAPAWPNVVVLVVLVRLATFVAHHLSDHERLNDLMYHDAPADHAAVERITFELVVHGNRQRVEFLRPEKIADLLTAEDVTLGAWLRSIVNSRPKARPEPGAAK